MDGNSVHSLSLAVHSPHSPMVMEMKNTIEASAPTSLVFHARNAEIFDAIVRGVRRG